MSKDIYMKKHLTATHVARKFPISHVKIHSDKKPFDCFLCDKKFSELIFVRVHSDEKPFGCYSCEKKFLQTPNFKYNDHVRIH